MASRLYAECMSLEFDRWVRARSEAAAAGHTESLISRSLAASATRDRVAHIEEPTPLLSKRDS